MRRSSTPRRDSEQLAPPVNTVQLVPPPVDFRKTHIGEPLHVRLEIAKPRQKQLVESLEQPELGLGDQVEGQSLEVPPHADVLGVGRVQTVHQDGLLHKGLRVDLSEVEWRQAAQKKVDVREDDSGCVAGVGEHVEKGGDEREEASQEPAVEFQNEQGEEDDREGELEQGRLVTSTLAMDKKEKVNRPRRWKIFLVIIFESLRVSREKTARDANPTVSTSTPKTVVISCCKMCRMYSNSKRHTADMNTK